MSKKTRQRKQAQEREHDVGNRRMRMKLNFVVAHSLKGEFPFFGLLEIHLAGDLASNCDEILAQLPSRIRLAHPGGQLQLVNADTDEPIYTSPAVTAPTVLEAFKRTIKMTHHWFIRLWAQPPYPTPWHTDFVVRRDGTFGPMPISPEYILRDLATPLERLQKTYNEVQGSGEAYLPWIVKLTEMINDSVVGPAPLGLKRLDGLPGQHVVLDGESFATGERHWKALFKTSFMVYPLVLPTSDERTNHEHVVANFLETIQSTSRWCRKHDAFDEIHAAGGQGVIIPTGAELQLLQQRLDDARVFELTVEDDHILIAHAEKHLKRMLRIPARTLIRDAEGIADALASLATQVELPLPLPFKSMYIGLGEGNHHSEDQQWPLGGGAARSGWLICEDGYIFNFDMSLQEGTNAWLITPTVMRRPSGWLAALHLPGKLGFHDIAPWVFHLLIEALKDFRTTRVSHGIPKKLQFKCDQIAKETHRPPIPPLFYQVTMQDLVINDARRKFPRLKIPVEWTYRWDVTGHERHLFRYGQQPLDDATRADLLARKYTIYEDSAAVPPEVVAHLHKRHLPQLAAGQWLAHHEVWIESDVRPHREDLPYVPSVRVPGTKLEL